jgi:hypothetical protein
VRGQAFRGVRRETFNMDRRDDAYRSATQVRCARSLIKRVLEPYEATGHHVSVFLTLYQKLWGSRADLVAAFAPRVVSVNTLHHDSTPSQILPIAAAVQDFLNWCAKYGEAFDAVLVTRFDIYFKSSLLNIMGRARAVDGFRLLWKETGGHWRQHANPIVVRNTFGYQNAGPGQKALDWRRTNVRTPDTLIGFAGSLARCFLNAALFELFPDSSCSPKVCPLNFLHNLAGKLLRALPARSIRFMVAGGFDSNPCRAACMLNPLYDILPRMDWITDSRICQTPSDFTFDNQSQSLCCPSINYCCPNSVANCSSPDAIRFDAVSAAVPAHVILKRWPPTLGQPYNWEMTPRSYLHVAHVWRNAARAQGSMPHFERSRLERAAIVLLRQATARGRLSHDAYAQFTNQTFVLDQTIDCVEERHGPASCKPRPLTKRVHG